MNLQKKTRIFSNFYIPDDMKLAVEKIIFVATFCPKKQRQYFVFKAIKILRL